jgi:hypothetical protein
MLFSIRFRLERFCFHRRLHFTPTATACCRSGKDIPDLERKTPQGPIFLPRRGYEIAVRWGTCGSNMGWLKI